MARLDFLGIHAFKQRVGLDLGLDGGRLELFFGNGADDAKGLRVGFKNTGIEPVMMIACKIDLWHRDGDAPLVVHRVPVLAGEHLSPYPWLTFG